MPRLGSRVRVSFSALSDVLKMTYAQVAELVDAHVSGACVERHAGSSPVLGTLFVKRASFAEIAQLVEHNLAKVRVASSSLVFRSFLCFVKETEIPASFMGQRISPVGKLSFKRIA